MNEINLPQSDADALLALEKQKVDDIVHEYPILGGSIRVPLVSCDRREEFVLDVYQNQINLAKGTYQNRARKVVILARLDFGGSPHRNPDDEEISCPHLHLYCTERVSETSGRCPCPWKRFQALRTGGRRSMTS